MDIEQDANVAAYFADASLLIVEAVAFIPEAFEILDITTIMAYLRMEKKEAAEFDINKMAAVIAIALAAKAKKAVEI